MAPIYATLALCALAAAFLVVRYDLYEKEPVGMLVLAAGLGGAAMWIVGHVEDLSLEGMGGVSAGPGVLAAIAATHEEAARLAIVVLLAALLPSQVNDPIDGLIYGSIVGLGMAVEESRYLIALEGLDGWLLPGTEPVRLVGHLVLGGIVGFPVGFARVSPRWAGIFAGCFAASVGIHFFWDWIAFAAAEAAEPSGAQTLSVVVLMLVGMGIYGWLVVKGSDESRKLFAPDSKLRVWSA